jgi:hypothetical protein
MQKTDLTKLHRSYYTAKTKPELLEIEEANYLSLTGKGDPSSPQYAEALQALYATAYTLKFMYKAEGKDFTVAKLEGLWWFDEEKYKSFGISDAPKNIPRSEWEYRMLIRLPGFVAKTAVKEAATQVVAKKDIQLAGQVEFFTMKEGKVVQMLHVGPFDTEPETLEKIQEFIIANNLKRNGLHHEIYLSDFRKTAPEKLKTILREPVK